MSSARQVATAPRTIVGRPASAGFAAGPIFRMAEAVAARSRAVGDVAEERARLESALAATRAGLAALIDTLDDDEAKGIVEFQLSLLHDPTLTDAAFATLAPGVAGATAWATAIDVLVADYAAAADEYFRARASDLRDLRERVLRVLAGDDARPRALPAGAIVVARDLAPTRFLELDWAGRGIALLEGSATSHVATLARARGVAMVVGLGSVPASEGQEALLDAQAGTLTLLPDYRLRAAFAARRTVAQSEAAQAEALLTGPAVTASGEAVAVLLNVAEPRELDVLDPSIADGIGLVRTEFLFHGRADLPSEEEQLAVYRRLLEWAGPRPVTIRTLDAGGDKPIPGLTIDEANPFLGLRGVRLSLARPEVFRIQLRALLRAAPAGNLQVMLPMVAVPREMDAARALLDQVQRELERARIPHAAPRLGMMVEVPSAALTLDLFRTDFVSIGSNDLTQYVMAAARDSTALAPLADTAEPAVLRLIAETVRAGRALGIPVSLCGDAGGDARLIPLLLAAGLRSLSVAPAAVARTKLAVSRWRAADE
jgi:phosphotransferase system enzyme I (PtsI)